MIRMSLPTSRDLIDTTAQAGYRVVTIEHPRSTRWLLTVCDHGGQSIMLVVQARTLISASDVQDLAELVQVRRMQRGMLWAYNGDFSPAAHRTCAELGGSNLLLCTTL